MFITFLLLLLVSSSLQEEDEGGLYFINLNQKDEVFLMKLDIKSGRYEVKCNFGAKYGAPFKKYNDHLNLQTGTGIVDRWYNQFEVFLHKDEHNYQSGDILKCFLKNNTWELVGSYDFSCEHMFSGGAHYECASTRNVTGTNYIEIIQPYKTVDIQAQIPWVSKEEGGSSCFWDISQNNYYCMLYPVTGGKYKKNVRYMIDTDLGGSAVNTWVNFIRNQTEVYLIDALNINNWIAGIRFNQGKEERNAIVKLEYDTSTQNHFNWRMVGAQKHASLMKSISHNVYASCYYSMMFFYKAEDKDGKMKLLMFDFNTGNDKIIDTTKIGDLSYVSQMACL